MKNMRRNLLNKWNENAASSHSPSCTSSLSSSSSSSCCFLQSRSFLCSSEDVSRFIWDDLLYLSSTSTGRGGQFKCVHRHNAVQPETSSFLEDTHLSIVLSTWRSQSTNNRKTLLLHTRPRNTTILCPTPRFAYLSDTHDCNRCCSVIHFSVNCNLSS